MDLHSHLHLTAETRLRYFRIGFCILALSLDSPPLALAASDPDTSNKRIALVVGNAAYKTSPLRNPVNDARALSLALSQLGFEVQLEENVSQQGFMTALRNFGNRLRETQGVGLFYYAGHGMQIKGGNYLIPVDAAIEAEDEVRYFSIDAGQVLDKMEQAGNRLNIVILDACRDNPFARSFRSKQSGLAQMDAPSGMLIAFATSPGSVAFDGDGNNGVYTKHLLRNLTLPGLPIELVLKRVREGVSSETAQKQIPWESSSLLGDFIFALPKSGTAAPVTAVADNPAVELAFWTSVKDSTVPEEFVAYLKAFPDGRFADLAQARMIAAKSGARSSESRSSPPTQLALAQPGSVASPRSTFPATVGDTWTYLLTVDGEKRPQAVSIRLVSINDRQIGELAMFDRTPVPNGERVFRPGIQPENGFRETIFTENVVLTEFAPYIFPAETLQASTELPDVEADVLLSKAGGEKTRVTMSLRILGSERVRVPAGEFSATRIEARSKPAGVVLTYWYSPEVRRAVKITRRQLAFAGGLPSEQVFELAGYQQSR